MRIRQIGDPILRQVSRSLSSSQIVSAEIQALVERMQTILNGIKAISDENGNALSAPQVGSLVRLILLRIDGEFTVMINPEYRPSSERTFLFEEECFSLYDQRASLKRWYEIEVEYFDSAGVKRELSCRGELAGLIQHEVDHLNGVLFIDHAEKENIQLSSIDTLLSDQPDRLEQVKVMIRYMRG